MEVIKLFVFCRYSFIKKQHTLTANLRNLAFKLISLLSLTACSHKYSKSGEANVFDTVWFLKIVLRLRLHIGADRLAK